MSEWIPKGNLDGILEETTGEIHKGTYRHISDGGIPNEMSGEIVNWTLGELLDGKPGGIPRGILDEFIKEFSIQLREFSQLEFLERFSTKILQKLSMEQLEKFPVELLEKIATVLLREFLEEFLMELIEDIPLEILDFFKSWRNRGNNLRKI